MVPTSSLSLSIGTMRRVRAPATSAKTSSRWIAFTVRRLRPNVVDLRYLLGPGDAGHGFPGGDGSPHVAPSRRIRRRVVQRDVLKCLSVVKTQVAELGFANPHRVRQHGLKYRLKFTR